MTDTATVTVVITAFDHERYITQAVESVLTQETPFAYDVIVIDDCSNDRTVAALDRLAERFPGRFELRLAPVNRNDHRDFAAALDECRSPYLAMLDGDDYWTSTNKLAQQVNFLEQHREYAVVCHPVDAVDKDGHPAPLQFDRRGSHYSRDDLWAACFVHTGSVVFRRSAFDRLPDWYQESTFGDWELLLLLTLRGDIWFLDGHMSVYRLHEGGEWSGLGSRGQARQVQAFYDHMERVWGRGFSANRAATLSRAVTLAYRFGEVGASLPAWRWLAEAVVRAGVRRPGEHGPSRREIRRLLVWQARCDRDRLRNRVLKLARFRG